MSLESLGLDLAKLEVELAGMSAENRVAWGLKTFTDKIVMTSSFGAQSALLLHMVTTQSPVIPVILFDTGHLFPETYRFIDQLTARLQLNLKVYRAEISSAWQEARYGKMWEKGLDELQKYNYLNKVEPKNRAMKELGAQAWLAGLRRQQSSTRKDLSFLRVQDGLLKVHPILDWTDKDVYDYLLKHDLPYHPLWEQGYGSIGDVHTTRKLEAGMTEEETRFFGLKRECGLHEIWP